MGGFLFAGILVAFLGGLAAIFLELAGVVARRVGGFRAVDGGAHPVPFEGKLRYAGVEEGSIHQYRIAAKDSALRQMQRLAAEVDLDPDAARFCVLHGDASRHIVEQEQDCDLIVIGKHGRNALEELLLGGVSKHVLAESTRDVMVSVQSTG
jgi:nucleotide-binding universal stress UspA family protein